MDSSTGSLEDELIAAAEKLEKTAGQLGEIYANSRQGEIEAAGKSGAVNSLQKEGALVYRGILPFASELFSSWPELKQIRAMRQLRVAMSRAGFFSHYEKKLFINVEEIESGIYDRRFEINQMGLKTMAYGLRELVSENRNPDESDEYYDRIKYSTIVQPRPGYRIQAQFFKADKRGCFERCDNLETDSVAVEAAISELVGSKVIFYPLCTKDDLVCFDRAWDEKPEIPFEFEMKTGVIKKIRAEEFYPLKRKSADYIKGFFRENIFRKS